MAVDATHRAYLVEKLLKAAYLNTCTRTVGAVIAKLKGADAEVVMTLTADDFNHRIN